MKVLVASKNPVKINATKITFEKVFNKKVEVIGISVSSGVSDMPLNEDTFNGATNRVMELYHMNQKQNLQASFFVGIEGGLVKMMNKWLLLGAIVIMDTNKNISLGTAPGFEVPEKISQKAITEGKEIGLIMDEITGESNTKQKMGAIGFLTNGNVTRQMLYEQAIQMALIPFLKNELYFKK